MFGFLRTLLSSAVPSPFALGTVEFAGEEAKRGAQGVADHVGQRVVLPGLPDAVALAQPFHLDYRPVHPLTIRFRICQCRILDDSRETGSLGRFVIMRRWVVRALKTQETGIAISAAERSDSDCPEKTLLHGTAPMRSIYLGTTTMWTELFEFSLHSLHHVPDFRFQRLKSSRVLQHG